MSWGRIEILDSEIGSKVFEFLVVELLSIIRSFGILNLQIMDLQTKLRTFCSVIVANGSASAHLVK